MKEENENGKNIAKNCSCYDVVRVMSIVRDTSKGNEKCKCVNDELNKWSQNLNSSENNKI